MTVDRRLFLTGLAATLGLSGCMDTPAALTVSAQGAAGMNPGADGVDRPVTITILQLRGAGAFDGADFFALQDPSSALGGDLVQADQIVLAPGTPVSKIIGIQPGATIVGITAGFRDPTGKQFRAKIAAPASAAGLIVSVGPSGIQLKDA